MPDFQAYHVRDRESWLFYRERTAPRGPRPVAEIEADIAAFDPADRPVAVRVGSPWTTWGLVRDLMGPERACTVMYDDPALAHDIIDTGLADFEAYTAPLIERIRPDILQATEDICYNHGMLISPKHFEEFCSPYYRRVTEVARDCGADMLAVDTDGNAMDFVSVAERAGINTVFPFESKAGNDLFILRERHPEFILMGWLEKEVVNAGEGDLIEPEIMSKVPRLLAQGRYFPNGDHCIQPLVDFENLCRFMTLLHEVNGNPEGEFPRMR
jgi:uroporphyrinogen-III decarboxylase